MYTIEFSKTAEKQLFKLDEQTQERIASVLERIRARPYHFIKRLVGEPDYKLRVGDYRIILNVDEKTSKIFIFELGHRKNIYN